MLQASHSLVSVIGASKVYGSEAGAKAFAALSSLALDAASRSVIKVSMTGLEVADSTFFRESVVSLAKLFLGLRPVCVTDLECPDLLENLHCGALARKIPITVWSDSSVHVVGPLPKPSAMLLLDHVLRHKIVSSVEASAALGISVQNASARLKLLSDQGYFHRVEESSPSGGIQHIYKAIGA